MTVAGSMVISESPALHATYAHITARPQAHYVLAQALLACYLTHPCAFRPSPCPRAHCDRQLHGPHQVSASTFATTSMLALRSQHAAATHNDSLLRHIRHACSTRTRPPVPTTQQLYTTCDTVHASSLHMADCRPPSTAQTAHATPSPTPTPMPTRRPQAIHVRLAASARDMTPAPLAVFTALRHAAPRCNDAYVHNACRLTTTAPTTQTHVDRLTTRARVPHEYGTTRACRCPHTDLRHRPLPPLHAVAAGASALAAPRRARLSLATCTQLVGRCTGRARLTASARVAHDFRLDFRLFSAKSASRVAKDPTPRYLSPTVRVAQDSLRARRVVRRRFPRVHLAARTRCPRSCVSCKKRLRRLPLAATRVSPRPLCTGCPRVAHGVPPAASAHAATPAACTRPPRLQRLLCIVRPLVYVVALVKRPRDASCETTWRHGSLPKDAVLDAGGVVEHILVPVGRLEKIAKRGVISFIHEAHEPATHQRIARCWFTHRHPTNGARAAPHHPSVVRADSKVPQSRGASVSGADTATHCPAHHGEAPQRRAVVNPGQRVFILPHFPFHSRIRLPTTHPSPQHKAFVATGVSVPNFLFWTFPSDTYLSLFLDDGYTWGYMTPGGGALTV
ncbi:hypothetical protein GGX14DRAFT_607556 [Mycena pura]|uniref:Uncharacterized protein n=1 Tax=Mycena pura TaxID=153505 RepID=A0AAD6XZH2_9AGAR|nr:hypothetical protein GGX14DRAFT_607556 [Mycena pura]